MIRVGMVCATVLVVLLFQAREVTAAPIELVFSGVVESFSPLSSPPQYDSRRGQPIHFRVPIDNDRLQGPESGLLPGLFRQLDSAAFVWSSDIPFFSTPVDGSTASISMTETQLLYGFLIDVGFDGINETIRGQVNLSFPRPDGSDYRRFPELSELLSLGEGEFSVIASVAGQAGMQPPASLTINGSIERVELVPEPCFGAITSSLLAVAILSIRTVNGRRCRRGAQDW